jgi:hypothetical protein
MAVGKEVRRGSFHTENPFGRRERNNFFKGNESTLQTSMKTSQ